MNILEVIGRSAPMFGQDVSRHEQELRRMVGLAVFW